MELKNFQFKMGKTIIRVASLAIVIAFIFSISISDLDAQKSGTGIGIMLGEPTGLSFKTNGNIAAGLAWSFSKGEAIHVHLDYLKHHRVFSGDLREKMPLHYGIGARIKFRNDDFIAGVRIPVGLTFEPPELPIDIFIEVVPTLDVIPDMDFDFGAAIGARYYF